MIAAVKAVDIEKIAKEIERYRKIQQTIKRLQSPNCSFEEITRLVLGDLTYGHWLTPEAKQTMQTELRVTAVNVLTDQLDELKAQLAAQGVVWGDGQKEAAS